MADAQSQAGVSVTVAATDDNGAGHLNRADIPCSAGVRYEIFVRQSRFYTFSWPLTLWLWRNVRKFDVIHIHALFSYPSTAAAVCAKVTGTPFIVRPLGTLNQWGMQNRKRWLKTASFLLLESRILRWAALVHFTSEQEAFEAGLLRVPYRSAIVPNPVMIPASPANPGISARPSHLQGKTVILFLSRIDAKKGLDLLLPAFRLVQREQRDSILVIVGDGDPEYVSAMKALANELEIAESVVWRGFLDGHDKESIMRSADIFVLPSYSENFGVAVVEAMGAGLPVIVSDQVGIHREIAREQAGLVVHCGEEALATALLKASRESAWRASAGAAGRELAKQFSPLVVSKQCLNLYRRVATVSSGT